MYKNMKVDDVVYIKASYENFPSSIEVTWIRSQVSA
jgi:hypothetical protein